MTKKKTHEDFVKDVYNLVGDEYTVVGKYTLSKNKVELRHNECGELWEVKANNFINGNRCKYCREKSKIKNKCLKHKTVFTSSPSNALRKNKKFLCPSCVGENSNEYQKKSIEELIKNLKDKHNDRIILEGEYVNTHTKTLFKCTECSKTFNSEPNQVIRLSGCPYCNSSKGELLIDDLLTENNIYFEREKRFDDCRYKKALPFDFYIPSINTLIEFDGLQHTKPIEFFGGIEAFKETQIRDSIKTKYA